MIETAINESSNTVAGVLMCVAGAILGAMAVIVWVTRK